MMNNKGFTLVELIIAIAVATIMFMAIYGAIESAQRSSTSIERKVAAQQDAKGAIQIMGMEIQMASYDPNQNNAIWIDVVNNNNCLTASLTPLNRGLQFAGAFAINVQMDINDSGIIQKNNNPNEIITYNYNPVNRVITRETNCGGEQPFLGANPATVVKRTVLVVNDIDGNGAYTAGVDVPVFRYFDGQNNELIPFGTPPLLQTADIQKIRRILITLVIDTEDIDPMTNQRRRMLYSTSVVPRNHAICPGCF